MSDIIPSNPAAASAYSIFIDACCTQTPLFIFYMLTVWRTWYSKVQLNFVFGTGLLLGTTCLTWIVECYLKYKYLVTTDGVDTPCYQQTNDLAHSQCTWFTLFQIANMVCYNCGMWLFAMRYWTLSKILAITMNKDNPDKHFKALAMITWFGFALMLLICLMFSMLMFYGKTSNFIILTPIMLWSFSFVFLADGLRRIKQVMKGLTDVVIIYEAFFVYAATACLAIFGQVPVIVLTFS